MNESDKEYYRHMLIHYRDNAIQYGSSIEELYRMAIEILDYTDTDSDSEEDESAGEYDRYYDWVSGDF